MRQLNRITPAAPARAFRSFGMKVTAHSPASCEDVGCGHWANGWLTSVAAGSQDEKIIAMACDGSADGIRRAYASRVQAGESVQYWFAPGTPCFRAASHRIPQEARWHHRDGDWRVRPSGLVVHPDAQSWHDELGEHQERIAGQRQRYGAQ